MVLVYIRIYQIAKSRTRAPPGDRRRRDDDKKENGHCHERLNGDAAEGNGKDDRGDVNAVDVEESSSSYHKVTNPCSSKKKRAKGKTKLSQIKPGEVFFLLLYTSLEGYLVPNWTNCDHLSAF